MKGYLFNNKKYVVFAIILFIVVCGGFYIRVIKLGETSLSFVEPLHIYPAKSILETGEPTLPSGSEYSRALWFTQLVALSFKLFGINEFSARFPSVVFGTLSIIVVFFIGRSFFGIASGLIAAFMTAFVPFEIVMSRESRMYTMFQFFFLLAFFAFYMGFEKENHKVKVVDTQPKAIHKRLWLNIEFLQSYWNLNWRWLLFSLILFYISFKVHVLTGIYYLSILFYLFSMSFFTLLTDGFERTIRSKYLFFFLLLVVTLCIGLVMFPEYSGSLIDLFNFSPLWSKGSGGPSLYYFFFLVEPWLFPIGALFIIGIIQICVGAHKAGFYTLVCIAVPLILHSLLQVKQPRYIFEVFPLILLVSSYGLYSLFRYQLNVAYSGLRNKKIKYLSYKNLNYGILIFLSLLWLFPSFGWFRQSFKAINHPIHAQLGGEHHAEWKGACQYVKNFYKTGDIIISTLPLAALHHCGTVDYALDKAHYFGSADYSLDEIPSKLRYKSNGDGFYIDYYSGTKAIVSLNDLKRVLSKNPRAWLVLDKQRFESETIVPKDVREFISKNLVNHATKADETMVVFSWDKDNLAAHHQ